MSGKSNMKIFILALAVVLLTMVSCGGRQSTPGAAAAVKDTLVIVSGTGGFNNLDPQAHSAAFNTSVLSNIYEGMILRTDDGFEPLLATSWRQVDPVTWEFNLRNDVFFHNGEKFNAEAMKFSLDRTRSEEHRILHNRNFQSIASVEVVNEYTIRVITYQEDPIMITRLAMDVACAVPPRHVSSMSQTDFALDPVGTGPYKFVRNDGGIQLTMVRNDEYWGGPPPIREVTWRIITETGSRMAELQAGTADIVDGVPYDQLAMLQANPNVQISISWNIRTVYIQFDYEQPPVNDVRIRQAVAHSLDMDTIIDYLLLGNGRRMASFSIPEVDYHDPNLELWTYDLARAEALIRQTGLTPPVNLTFDVATGRVPMDKELYEAITGMMNESGLWNINLIINEPGIYSQKLAETDHPRRLVGHMTTQTHGNNTFDPDFTLFRSFSYVDPPRAIVASHQNNRERDVRIREAGAELNSDRRRVLNHILQREIKEDAPRIYLYQISFTWGMASDLVWNPSGETIRINTIGRR